MFDHIGLRVKNLDAAKSLYVRAAGHDAEHIIVLGQRGIPDSAIRQRLMAEELVRQARIIGPEAGLDSLAQTLPFQEME